VLHDTKGLGPAAEALAASGSKAMHALKGRFRKGRITQYDMKCRMFDIMVEPVMSYASHVWGPELCHKKLRMSSYEQPCAAEKVHLAFLRYMTGTSKGTSIHVLMRDMHRSPVLHHWVVLAARWWERLHPTHAAFACRACLHSNQTAHHPAAAAPQTSAAAVAAFTQCRPGREAIHSSQVCSET
jgi:hypothetical protein